MFKDPIKSVLLNVEYPETPAGFRLHLLFGLQYTEYIISVLTGSTISITCFTGVCHRYFVLSRIGRNIHCKVYCSFICNIVDITNI
jgi:hypothetical protein